MPFDWLSKSIRGSQLLYALWWRECLQMGFHVARSQVFPWKGALLRGKSLRMRFRVQSWLQKPAFPMLLVFDFRLKAIQGSQNKQSHSCYFHCFASSQSLLHIQQNLKKATLLHLSKGNYSSSSLLMFRSSQLDRQVAHISGISFFGFFFPLLVLWKR